MTTKKIYLPKWQRFFIVPFFVGFWIFLTYLEFFDPNNADKIGTIGYVFTSVLFLGLTVMMWLMTSGKLPAYIIKETKDKKP